MLTDTGLRDLLVVCGSWARAHILSMSLGHSRGQLFGLLLAEWRTQNPEAAQRGEFPLPVDPGEMEKLQDRTDGEAFGRIDPYRFDDLLRERGVPAELRARLHRDRVATDNNG